MEGSELSEDFDVQQAIWMNSSLQPDPDFSEPSVGSPWNASHEMSVEATPASAQTFYPPSAEYVIACFGRVSLNSCYAQCFPIVTDGVPKARDGNYSSFLWPYSSSFSATARIAGRTSND